MLRSAFVTLFVLAATGAAAQQPASPAESPGRFDAAAYIRGVLANDAYDPRDRERALNGARALDASTHYRSTVFDGRRTRATHGTGLRLPALPLPRND